MLIVACPGQGSQSQGFLVPWIENVAGFSDNLERLGKAANRDLIALGTTADEESIKDTANAQPLIVGASIAAYRTAFAKFPVSAVVGHSVGEFAAAAIAGVISDDDAMRLVTVRADAMSKAAKEASTSMAAVLGGEPELVLATLESLGLYAANFNGAGQIVAAGEKSRIEKLVAEAPAGTRCIELKVAGAFHTEYMESAVAELRKAASEVAVSDPKVKLLTNKDGSVVTSGTEFLELMVNQVASPVRWDLCMSTLDTPGAKLIELPPAGALAGLAKRGMPNTTAIAIKTPADLEKVEN